MNGELGLDVWPEHRSVDCVNTWWDCGPVNGVERWSSVLLHHSPHSYCIMVLSLTASWSSVFNCIMVLSLTASWSSVLMHHSPQSYCIMVVSLNASQSSVLLHHGRQSYCIIVFSLNASLFSVLLHHCPQSYCIMVLSLIASWYNRPEFPPSHFFSRVKNWAGPFFLWWKKLTSQFFPHPFSYFPPYIFFYNM